MTSSILPKTQIWSLDKLAHPDPGALSPGREFPRRMYHATKTVKTVCGAQEEADLGPEWSRVYNANTQLIPRVSLAE